MALQRATRTAGDFLDLKQVAADGPVLVIFRIREFMAAEPGDFGPALPVVADALIASGPRAGEMHMAETFRFAITSCLRGVPNPKKGEPIPAPAVAIGAEIVARVKVINAGKANAGAVGDEPSDAEYAAAEAIYAQVGGEGWRPAPVAAATNGALVGAGVGGGGTGPADPNRPF